MAFQDWNLSKPLKNALSELSLTTPTAIQEEVFSPILAGKDVVATAQTGTGKTFAYLLPILRNLKYSEQKHPRVLIVVPTRELTVQVTEEIKKLTPFMSVRVGAVYGGTNINTQKQFVNTGLDILVATPGRLLDLALSGVLRLKTVKQFVIDEVDEMLNLGFRPQLTNLLDILPQRRQNLLFSATMTEEVEGVISDFFTHPIRIAVAPPGKPLPNIDQSVYPVENQRTKFNLLLHLLENHPEWQKVLLFVETKKLADQIEDFLTDRLIAPIGVVHSNKSQNYRLRMVEEFEKGELKILVATDLMARGIDFEDITHVINFDLPESDEGYLHRIGRTGRAKAKGVAINFVGPLDKEQLANVEQLMQYKIPENEFPIEVEISDFYTEEEQPNLADKNYLPEATRHGLKKHTHEKKDKNKKTNQGGSYKRKIKAKYKKPKTRGQKPRGKKR